MLCPRMASFASLVMALGLGYPASGQSIVSTHSGVVYFFEGTVFLGDQRLEQKFGKFPDIGEGRELRTGDGRAEVLLTPGVFLRMKEHSAIRLLSSELSDTKVELLDGSAILDSNDPPADTAVTLIHQSWQVRSPGPGVYRIDCAPAQVLVYKGEASVTTPDKSAPVPVHERELLPLAPVLVPEQSAIAEDDAFKGWAIGRSQDISSDNATAAAIVDDPSMIDSSGLPLGTLSYFPLTGIPGIAVTNPYGLSFWSPVQASLGSIYLRSSYAALYPGWQWPVSLRYSLFRRTGIFTGLSLGGGLRPIGVRPYLPVISAPHTTVGAPHVGAPHVVVRGGRR